ncbi:MAG: hypothetical protein ACYTGA_08785, partial [Planctomycetota bacterium]
AHKPFNDEYNGTGIIKGRQVLEMIARAYQAANRQSLPPVCEDIYLTIEVFSGTGDMPNDIIHRLRQTVEYWRQFVPTDGVHLDRLLGIDEKPFKKRHIIAADAKHKKRTAEHMAKQVR